MSKFIAVAVRTTATASDKRKVLDKLNQIVPNGFDASTLAIWRKTSDPTEKWILAAFAIDFGTVRRNITKAQIDTWRLANLDNPARCQVFATSENPHDDIVAMGYEPDVTIPEHP